MNTQTNVKRSGPEPLALPVLHTIRRARAGRKLALALLVLLMVLPVVLINVPWLQSVPGSGRIVAFSPEERIRTIPAPVTGRLVELLVRDGSVVKKGDLLVRMEDQDPGFFERLQQQFELDKTGVDFAKDGLIAIEEQLIQLNAERAAAIEEADKEIDAAFAKVKEARKKYEAADAERDQKALDLERKRLGRQQRVTSQLDLEEAERDYKSAKAKLEGAAAAEEAAIKNEDAKAAKRNKIAAKFDKDIADVRTKLADANVKLQSAGKKLNESETKVERQRTQAVYAPADGTVLSINGASTTDLIAKGAPLIEFMPDTDLYAVEMWMRGIDAPLIAPGRKARLVFEGWPAVQFAGWPSVAVGTFGGVVTVVDAQAASDGRVRLLILPDEQDVAWPEAPFLRQGARAIGWVQLETVSAGYEIWRQLNAFPPSIQTSPTQKGADEAKKKPTEETKAKS